MSADQRDRIAAAMRDHVPHERTNLECSCGREFEYDIDGVPVGWAEHLADVAVEAGR